MELPTKHSVAVIIREGDRLVAICRADDDDELPGIWGLPAGSLQRRETVEDLIHRIGRQKLGVRLRPVRKLAEGRQVRQTYQLEMELWEVAMEGTPTHPQWKWGELGMLKTGRDNGSLCCALALQVFDGKQSRVR